MTETPLQQREHMAPTLYCESKLRARGGRGQWVEVCTCVLFVCVYSVPPLSTCQCQTLYTRARPHRHLLARHSCDPTPPAGHGVHLFPNPRRQRRPFSLSLFPLLSPSPCYTPLPLLTPSLAHSAPIAHSVLCLHRTAPFCLALHRSSPHPDTNSSSTRSSTPDSSTT